MANNDVDLGEYDKEFQEAQPEEDRFGDLPDGKYQVQVDAVELKVTKTTGKPMFCWKLKVIGPHHAGRIIFKNAVIIAGTDAVKRLKTDLWTCGLQIERLSELKENMHHLLDIYLEIQQKTKGEYVNIYLNKRLQMEDVSTPEEGGPRF